MNPKNKESFDHLKNHTTLAELLQYKEVLMIYNDLEEAAHKDADAKAKAENPKG